MKKNIYILFWFLIGTQIILGQQTYQSSFDQYPDFSFDNYYGVIASENCELLSQGNYLGEKLVAIDKNDMVNIFGISYDVYKIENQVNHFYLVKTKDKKMGWVFGGDVIVVSKKNEAYPWYHFIAAYQRYLSVVKKRTKDIPIIRIFRKSTDVYEFRWGENLFNNPTSDYKVCSLEGLNLYFNEGILKDSYNIEWNIIFEWDETNGCFIMYEEKVDQPDRNSTRVFHENFNLLKFQRKYWSLDQYRLWQYIDSNDFVNLKNYLNDNFFLERKHYVYHNDSPCKYAIDNENIELLKILFDADFPNYFYNYDNQESLLEYANRNGKKNIVEFIEEYNSSLH